MRIKLELFLCVSFIIFALNLYLLQFESFDFYFKNLTHESGVLEGWSEGNSGIWFLEKIEVNSIRNLIEWLQTCYTKKLEGFCIRGEDSWLKLE